MGLWHYGFVVSSHNTIMPQYQNAYLSNTLKKENTLNMEFNTNKQEELVVALDIGTTKVCAVAGRRNEHGKLEIIGVGKVASKGVIRGVVTNIEKTVNAIKEAIAMAERQASQKFRVVHVGIAGQHINSLHHKGMVTRDSVNTEISKKDIDKLVGDMYRLVLPPGDKIIHVIPQEYAVDNEQGILDPIGMSGIRLEANFHIITGQISASNNIKKCIEKAGCEVADITLEPIASADSILSEEEKEAGVALVDIGGGTTDISIFYDGIIRHTAIIPFGGDVITKDIKEGCTVMKQQAEKLKVKFGSALAEEVYDNRVIAIPGLKGRDPKEISEKNLALIIQARVEEILDYVMFQIQRSGYANKLIGGIVLTGGGALLKNIDKLTEFHTGVTARIGIPAEQLAHGNTEQVYSPVYATGIGLLLRGIERVESGELSYTHEIKEVIEEVPVEAMAFAEETVARNTTNSTSPNEEKSYSKIFKRIKDWFEAEPDAELY